MLIIPIKGDKYVINGEEEKIKKDSCQKPMSPFYKQNDIGILLRLSSQVVAESLSFTGMVRYSSLQQILQGRLVQNLGYCIPDQSPQRL